MTKRVAILQSNYIPWRGYFDLMGRVDEFVLYDIVQFTKNDWRNRNRIKTAQGVCWLTVPVMTAGRFAQSIRETRVADRDWASKHWRTLSQSYVRAPHWERYRDRFAAIYEACGRMDLLTEINRTLLGATALELGLSTRISDASDYQADGDQTGRLVAICRALGATTYLSGPSAADYLKLGLFREAGIDVEFMDYSAYRPYPQLHGAFEPAVSVLDLLFNVGPDATLYMTCGQER